MSLKVLGGLAKGFTIATLKGDATRPTLVLLRRRLFDYIQNWEQKVFIDAMAGSGIMGLECLSRGAESVYFIDNDFKVIQNLNKNIQKLSERYPDLEPKGKCSITKLSFPSWLKKRIEQKDLFFDKIKENQENIIVFLDPPYAKLNLYRDSIRQLQDLNNMVQLEVWVEGDFTISPSVEQLEQWGLIVYKSFTQGQSYLHLCRFS